MPLWIHCSPGSERLRLWAWEPTTGCSLCRVWKTRKWTVSITHPPPTHWRFLHTGSIPCKASYFLIFARREFQSWRSVGVTFHMSCCKIYNITKNELLTEIKLYFVYLIFFNWNYILKEYASFKKVYVHSVSKGFDWIGTV